MEAAAWIAAILLGVIALFQIALAFGAPAGRAAWGGQNEGVLPTGLRVASALAGFVIYPALIVFVLASAGLITVGWMPGTGVVGMWILTGVFLLGALANFASRSKTERIWGPVSLIIAICCGVIALGL